VDNGHHLVCFALFQKTAVHELDHNGIEEEKIGLVEFQQFSTNINKTLLPPIPSGPLPPIPLSHHTGITLNSNI
jgi:hypothetical protein